MGKSIFQKIQKKRWAPGRYKNPYFRRGEKKRWGPWLILLVLIILVIAGIFYTLSADRFTIKNVNVSGTETIQPEKISSIAKDYLNQNRYIFFKNHNRFIFNTEDLRNSLNDRYAFETLEIGIRDSDLGIRVQEKTSELLWYTESEPHLVDLEGNIIRKLNENEISLLNKQPEPAQESEAEGKSEPGGQEKRLKSLPVFKDLNDDPVNPGESVLSEKEVSNIFTFQEHLNAQGIGYNEVQVDRLAGRWVSIVTDKGFRILFNPVGDIDQQAINLQTILRESVQEPEKLKYIDLRFDDHVYVK